VKHRLRQGFNVNFPGPWKTVCWRDFGIVGRLLSARDTECNPCRESRLTLGELSAFPRAGYIANNVLIIRTDSYV